MSRASAQAALPLELDWRAGTECASAAAIRDELARITRVPPGVVLQPLFARVEVHRSGATFVAALRTEHEGRSGQRRLEADSCRTLVRSITLVLALAFGPGVEVSESSQADSAQPRAAAPIAPGATTPPRGRPEASTEPPKSAGAEASSAASPDAGPAAADDVPARRWNLWLTGGAQFRLLPATAFVTSLGAELESSRFWLGLRAQLWPGVSDALRTEGVGSVEARYAALGIALRGCLVSGLDSVTLAVCGTFGAAAVRGTTSSDDRVDGGRSIAPWYTGELAAAVDWPRASRMRLRFEANVAASLTRPQFTIEGAGPAHRVPLFVPLLAAGLVLTL